MLGLPTKFTRASHNTYYFYAVNQPYAAAATQSNYILIMAEIKRRLPSFEIIQMELNKMQICSQDPTSAFCRRPNFLRARVIDLKFLHRTRFERKPQPITHERHPRKPIKSNQESNGYAGKCVLWGCPFRNSINYS